MTVAKGPLMHLLAGAMRGSSIARQGVERAQEALSGLSMALLDPDKQAAMTAYMYDLRGSYGVTALFDWEADWLAADLPPSPARLLVGGAGSGREVGPLLYDGHEVVAFDPAPSYVRSAQASLPEGGLLAYEVGGYEDLLRPEHPLAMTAALHGPYDAVLLGWGSFTHVASARDRQQVLRALRLLCPQGPLLMSFWLRHEAGQTSRSRPFRAGWTLGSLLRGGVPHGPPPPGDEMHAHAGFGHRFTCREIRDLAHGAGYRLRLAPSREQPYAHATLVPAAR